MPDKCDKCGQSITGSFWGFLIFCALILIINLLSPKKPVQPKSPYLIATEEIAQELKLLNRTLRGEQDVPDKSEAQNANNKDDKPKELKPIINLDALKSVSGKKKKPKLIKRDSRRQ